MCSFTEADAGRHWPWVHKCQKEPTNLLVGLTFSPIFQNPQPMQTLDISPAVPAAGQPSLEQLATNHNSRLPARLFESSLHFFGRGGRLLVATHS